MTLAPNWVPYAFPTSIVDTATNTTLGTATRLNFGPITLTIPETGSRTFSSVILHVGVRDRTTSGLQNDFTGVRMGIQLGAAAFADTDRTFTQAGSTAHVWDDWTLDVTSYFNTNFGAASTQTCQCALAVSQTTAANIGGNITAWLEITYAFDATVGTTRLKAIPIPIGSHSTGYTLVAAEVGSDGVNGPGASQWPVLTGAGGLIKEASPTIIQSYLFAEQSDAFTVAGADAQPEWTIDSTVVTRNVLGDVGTGTTQWYRDILDMSGFSSTATHAIKFRDVATTGKYNSMGAVGWVIYTYDKSSTTRILNAALLGLQQSGDTWQIPWLGGFTSAVAADATAMIFPINVQEPGTITLERAGAFLTAFPVQVGSSWQLSAGAQSFRAYVSNATAGTIDNQRVVHRCDYGSGWSLARGPNRLLLRMMTTAGINRASIAHAHAWVLYSSDVPAAGVEVATRALAFHGASYNTTSSVLQDIAAASQIAPAFQNAVWTLQSMLADGMIRCSLATNQQLALQVGASEFDGVGWQFLPEFRQNSGKLSSRYWAATLTQIYQRNWQDVSNFAFLRLDPQVAHRATLTITSSGLQSLILRPTVHSISYTLTGTVKVNGELASGITVFALATDTVTGVVETVASATTIAGGSFSMVVPDNTRTYRCVSVTAGARGASATGTAGVTSFNIVVGASAIALTGQPAVQTTATTATFTFTATGPVEYSLDGAAYVTTTSPLALSGLSAAAHAITFRLVNDPTDQQSFSWTAGASTGSTLELTGQPIVQTSSTSATFTFAASSAVEYSLDGGAFSTTTSPLVLSGLSAASHTITFRVVSDPTDKQTFTWTAGASGGSGDVTPPTQSVVSPPASTSFGTDYPHAKDIPAIVTVVDAASAVAFVMVFVQFSDRVAAELVYAGSGSQLGFLSPYKSYSTISGSGASGVGFTLSVRRDDSWPQSTNGLPISANFTYKAVDAAGNVLT